MSVTIWLLGALSYLAVMLYTYRTLKSFQYPHSLLWGMTWGLWVPFDIVLGSIACALGMLIVVGEIIFYVVWVNRIAKRWAHPATS